VEPIDESLLLIDLHGIPVIIAPDPTHDIGDWNSSANYQASECRSGPACSAVASDLDQLTALRTPVCLIERVERIQLIDGETKVRPTHVSVWPLKCARLPPFIEVETPVGRLVALDTDEAAQPVSLYDAAVRHHDSHPSETTSGADVPLREGQRRGGVRRRR
jgi:hypothetical protein